MLNIDALKTRNYNKIFVALSGGIDSCVLLHQLHHLKSLSSLEPPIVNSSELPALNKIEAIYINHQLSPDAEKWGDFCQQLCQAYQIPFHTRTVNAHPQKQQSPEAAARDARYQAFMEIVELNDILITAHHLDDQAETFLLRLCRGSGVKGLSAMSEWTEYQELNIFRPMLHISKQEIIEYAQQHQLSWINDESNNDCTYRRNFIRHQILPAFEELWPSMTKTLARVSQQQAEASLLLDELAEDDLSHCLSEERLVLVQYSIIHEKKLLTLSDSRIKNCIQYWLRKNKIPVLNAKLLEQLLIKLHQSNKPNMQLVVWRAPKTNDDRNIEYGLYKYRNSLFVYRFNKSKSYRDSLNQSYQLNLSHTDSIRLPNGKLQLINKQLDASKVDALKETFNLDKSRLASVSADDNVIICYRQVKMDAVFPDIIPGKKQNQGLKKFFQEHGIPECLREELPLIYINNNLVQVGNQLFNKKKIQRTSDSSMYLYFETDDIK